MSEDEHQELERVPQSVANFVRVIYVVPEDAEPWPEAKDRATEVLEDIRRFFADEMKRLGYGSQTFYIATDGDGAIIFDEIRSIRSKKEFLETDPKGKPLYVNYCKEAAGAAGLRNKNDVVVYFFESYSIARVNDVNAGSRGEKARGHLGGEAFLSSLHLKMARREWIANNNEYGGEVFEWICSTPMKGDELSWNGRGKKLGDVSGSGFGMIAHEFTHCFGVPNHTTDDDIRNRMGNLMGKGCRGMRGYFRSDLTDDRCVLSERTAQDLNESPFFEVRTMKTKL